MICFYLLIRHSRSNGQTLNSLVKILTIFKIYKFKKHKFLNLSLLFNPKFVFVCVMLPHDRCEISPNLPNENKVAKM